MAGGAGGFNSCSFQRESRSTESVCPNRRNRTGLRLRAGIETGNERLVDLNSASWNRISFWLRQIDTIRTAA